MIVVIDNYDSFVFNLARYFRCLGQQTRVIRNDELSVEAVLELQPTAIIISPGPCGPYEAGISIELVQKASGAIPILGICLGMQAIVCAFSGEVVRANVPIHGESSLVQYEQHPIFTNLPNPFAAGRYHSLIAEPSCVPSELRVIARCGKLVMAVVHRSLTVVGLQFHPESILTPQGMQLIANYLDWVGCSRNEIVEEIDNEFQVAKDPASLMQTNGN